MNFLLEIFLIIHFVVLIASLAVLHRNSYIYNGSEIFLRVLLILFIPILGSFIVLYQIGKFYKENKGSADGLSWYAFWESSDLGGSNSYSSHSDFGSSSDGGGGGD